jgi:hypothetical protein
MCERKVENMVAKIIVSKTMERIKLESSANSVCLIIMVISWWYKNNFVWNHVSTQVPTSIYYLFIFFQVKNCQCSLVLLNFPCDCFPLFCFMSKFEKIHLYAHTHFLDGLRLTTLHTHWSYLNTPKYSLLHYHTISFKSKYWTNIGIRPSRISYSFLSMDTLHDVPKSHWWGSINSRIDGSLRYTIDRQWREGRWKPYIC